MLSCVGFMLQKEEIASLLRLLETNQIKTNSVVRLQTAKLDNIVCNMYVYLIVTGWVTMLSSLKLCIFMIGCKFGQFERRYQMQRMRNYKEKVLFNTSFFPPSQVSYQVSVNFQS